MLERRPALPDAASYLVMLCDDHFAAFGGAPCLGPHADVASTMSCRHDKGEPPVLYVNQLLPSTLR